LRWVLLVLCVIVLLFLLLCLLRVGALVALDGTVTVKVRAGPVHIQVAPPKAKKPKKEKGPKQEKPKKEKPKKEKKGFPKPGLADIRSALETLWPPLIKALNRTRKGIRIDPLTLGVFFGGAEDPASAAQTMGYAHAAVWSGMPALERALDIPNPSIHLETDFLEESTKVRGQVGISIRIGTLLAVGLQAAFPALKWLLGYLKKHKNDEKAHTKEKKPDTQTENNSAA